MQVFAKSEVGLVRSVNEDRFLATDDLLAVADGMGGHLAGEVAAEIAINKLKGIDLGQVVSLKEFFLDIFQEANRTIFETGINNKDQEGMGTTLTAVYVRDMRAYIAHVGDSRAYLIRQNDVIQLTEDHSYVNQLVALGTLTEEEAEKHPQRNVLLRVLGTKESVNVDTIEVELQEKDRIVVASDGLFSDVNKDFIKEIFISGLSLEETVDRLIKAALDEGGKDNVTVVIGEV